jgi:Flp pilus assembly secretin CpaC
MMFSKRPFHGQPYNNATRKQIAMATLAVMATGSLLPWSSTANTPLSLGVLGNIQMNGLGLPAYAASVMPSTTMSEAHTGWNRQSHLLMATLGTGHGLQLAYRQNVADRNANKIYVDPYMPVLPMSGDGAMATEDPMMLAAAVDDDPMAMMAYDHSPFVLGIQATVNEMDLTMGKAEVLGLKHNAARVAVSDPNVVEAVILSPRQIQLVGKKIGVANILIWENNGSVTHHVMNVNVQRDVSSLAKQLRKLDPGINVLPVAAEDSVILTGTVASSESSQLALELAKAYFSGSSTGGSGGGISSMASALGGGGNNSSSGLSSQAPGSSSPGNTPNIINLMKVKGQPTTKAALVRQKLAEIHPNIVLDIIPGPNGSEKAILTGRVPMPGLIAKAINTVSAFYGQPGIKVLAGPGGNGMPSQTSGGSSPSLSTSSSGSSSGGSSGGGSDPIQAVANVLQGSVITDATGNVISLMQLSQKPQITCSIRFLDVSRIALNQLGSSITGTRNKVGFSSLSGAQSPASGKGVSTFVADDSGQAFMSSSSRNNLTGVNTASTLTRAFGSSRTLQDGITQVISVSDKFQAAISALEERRQARSLAEPSLTMLSGEKANFLAGGEVPIPVLGSNGQVSVEYHQFGILLSLLATVTDEGKINITIAPEVSSVDPSNGISTTSVTIPGFRKRSVNTTLELNSGESFMIAGLYNQEDTRSASQLPGIGNLPIIGSFFRNKWSDKRDDELVVIVRPEIHMIPVPEQPSWEVDQLKKQFTGDAEVGIRKVSQR